MNWGCVLQVECAYLAPVGDDPVVHTGSQVTAPWEDRFGSIVTRQRGGRATDVPCLISLTTFPGALQNQRHKVMSELTKCRLWLTASGWLWLKQKLSLFLAIHSVLRMGRSILADIIISSSVIQLGRYMSYGGTARPKLARPPVVESVAITSSEPNTWRHHLTSPDQKER